MWQLSRWHLHNVIKTYHSNRESVWRMQWMYRMFTFDMWLPFNINNCANGWKNDSRELVRLCEMKRQHQQILCEMYSVFGIWVQRVDEIFHIVALTRSLSQSVLCHRQPTNTFIPKHIQWTMNKLIKNYNCCWFPESQVRTPDYKWFAFCWANAWRPMQSRSIYVHAISVR